MPESAAAKAVIAASGKLHLLRLCTHVGCPPVTLQLHLCTGGADLLHSQPAARAGQDSPADRTLAAGAHRTTRHLVEALVPNIVVDVVLVEEHLVSIPI